MGAEAEALTNKTNIQAYYESDFWEFLAPSIGTSGKPGADRR